MIDEKRLILSVKSGSEKAYRTLYEMWVSRLYQFVYQYLKSEEKQMMSYRKHSIAYGLTEKN